ERGGTLPRHLPNDRRGQELLIDAERQQMLLIHRVEQAPGARRRHPSAARHVERAARRQRTPCELLFKLRGRDRPVRGQPIDDEILEPHDRGSRKGRAVYGSSLRAPVLRARRYRATSATRRYERNVSMSACEGSVQPKNDSTLKIVASCAAGGPACMAPSVTRIGQYSR